MQSYNDGYLKVYNKKDKKTNFNANLNPNTSDDFEFVVKLAYEETSRREQDYEFARSIERSLTLKVKTPLYPNVNKKHSVFIENTQYSIFELDVDRKKNEMYFYLEEVRKIDT